MDILWIILVALIGFFHGFLIGKAIERYRVFRVCERHLKKNKDQLIHNSLSEISNDIIFPRSSKLD